MSIEFAIMVAVTIFGAILSGVIGKYGVSVFSISFWRPRTYYIKGTLDSYGLLDRNSYKQYKNDLNQHLDKCTFFLRGESAILIGQYISTKQGQPIFSGKFYAEGTVKGNYAYLIYQINDSATHQQASGVLLLSIPDWGNVTGQFLVSSNLNAGKIVLGSVTFERQSAITSWDRKAG